jgi:hypothetical protein
MSRIIFHFKKGHTTLATRKMSDAAVILPRLTERVVYENDNENLSGNVIAVEHRILREPKEVWVVVECE